MICNCSCGDHDIGLALVVTDGMRIKVTYWLALTARDHTRWIIIVHRLADHLSTLNAFSVSCGVLYLIHGHFHVELSNSTAGSYPDTSSSIIGFIRNLVWASRILALHTLPKGSILRLLVFVWYCVLQEFVSWLVLYRIGTRLAVTRCLLLLGLVEAHYILLSNLLRVLGLS